MKIKQIIICISEFLSSTSYTILSSFYPGLAVSKGIPIWLIGIIFSLDPLVGLPFSVIAGKNMRKIGRRFVLIFGMSLGSVGMLLIAFIESSDYTGAIIISILSRVISGIGAGCSMTAAPSILISEYPEETDKLIGYFEAASGLGLLVGPLLGSLFSLFDITLSFYLTSGVFAIYTIIAYFVIGKLKPVTVNTEILSFSTIIFKPKLFLNFCAQLWLLFSLGYLSTIIELHLKSFGQSSFMVGILFGFCTTTYFLSSLFETKISHCCLPQITIIIGILGTSVSFLLIGPWELLFGHTVIPVIIGLGSLGISGALMYIPTTGLIIKQATTEYGLKYDDRLLDSISAITNFFSNVGEASGPFVAGFISEEIGFSNGCSLIGVLSIVFCVVYISFILKCKSNSSKTTPVFQIINSEERASENNNIEPTLKNQEIISELFTPYNTNK